MLCIIGAGVICRIRTFCIVCTICTSNIKAKSKKLFPGLNNLTVCIVKTVESSRFTVFTLESFEIKCMSELFNNCSFKRNSLNAICISIVLIAVCARPVLDVTIFSTCGCFCVYLCQGVLEALCRGTKRHVISAYNFLSDKSYVITIKLAVIIYITGLNVDSNSVTAGDILS